MPPVYLPCIVQYIFDSDCMYITTYVHNNLKVLHYVEYVYYYINDVCRCYMKPLDINDDAFML